MTREMRVVVAAVLLILGIFLMVKMYHHFEHYGRECITLIDANSQPYQQCTG